MTFITLDWLAASAPDGRRLFENLILAFGRERTAIVGRNGVGKTTLLRLILGEMAPAEGAVSVTGRLGVLRQSFAPPEGASVADLLGVASGLARLARIEAGQGTEDDLSEADWTLPQTVADALTEVGLADVDLTRPAAGLSGGEATRAGLAALLIAAPDVLILDEPTNNLDVEARAIVAAVLRRWKGGAIVVSHDRTLLAEMDRIVELTSIGASVYGGNFALYLARKVEEEAAAGRKLEDAEKAAARVERETQTARERKDRKDAGGRRMAARGDQPNIVLGAMAERAENSSGRASHLAERQRAQAAEDLAAARERVERVRRLAFDLPSSGLPAGKTVLAFDHVSFAWPDAPPLLRDVSFQLTGARRMAVVGRNGAGKTTLLKLASGELIPTAGTVRAGVSARLLDQKTSLLDDRQSLLENFRRLNPTADDNTAHAALARFLFRNVAALKPAGALSGGERLRAALACLLCSGTPPQLLILDEPTNHLDLESIEAVEAALAGYDGALLVVSHDAAFLDAIAIEETLGL